MSNNNKKSGNMNKKRNRSARKARTRKPKFLSLRLQLAADKTGSTPRPPELPNSAATTTTSDGRPQLNLFPLHPENLLEEKDAAAHEENYVAAYNFFSAAESGATSLSGLLGAPSTSTSSGQEYRNKSVGNKAFSSPDSLRYPYGCRGAAALVRTALRSKERKPCEEKWVSYSEVVENERKDEEVTSSAASDLRRSVIDNRSRLSLKLDYQEIINAWSDRGSLYTQSECPQTVPDIIQDEFFSCGYYETSPHGTWERSMSLYTVPEMVGSSSRSDGENPPQDGGNGGDEEAAKQAAAGQIHRAASVLRYKEKRQNRLFSKTIRYQVRKLNAEKRPRIKGRFVKRN